MRAPLARVGDLAEQIRGVTYAKGDASGEPLAGYVPLLRAGNISDEGLTLADLVFVPSTRISERQLLRRNDVLVATSSGSLDVVGKAALISTDLGAGFGAFCKVLRPSEKVHAGYFAHFFKTPDYRGRISTLAAGANINNLRNEDIDDLTLPLPPITEQRRIAGILDRADALLAKRREALAQLDGLTQAIFLEMFGDPVANTRRWPDVVKLGEVADIVSGVTKGRPLKGRTARVVPYLAVSNVQDRHLNLEVVKEIEATEDEIRLYRLQRDDVLLTEGGDPDKLGRGTLWNEELPECIHQNHIFRVRASLSVIRPTYLTWLLGSARGKKYFLRSAKQTTGIASINMTQLRGFPLLIPPLALQDAFGRRAAAVDKLKASHRASLSQLDALFASLQHRAFRGEL